MWLKEIEINFFSNFFFFSQGLTKMSVHCCVANFQGTKILFTEFVKQIWSLFHELPNIGTSDPFSISMLCATMWLLNMSGGWNDSLSKQHLPHHWLSPAWGLQVSWDAPHNFKDKFPLVSTHRTLGINEKPFQRWQNYNVA